MRVSLVIASGADAGRQVTLLPGQQCQVGRSPRADLVLPADMCMSSVHFAIEAGAETCMLRDLGSRNGTFLNGAMVHEAVVNNGDQVFAGETAFMVQVEETVARIGFLDDPSHVPTQPVRRRPAGTLGTFRQLVCDSGLSQFVAASDAPRPAELARLLAQAVPLYVTIDPNRFGGSMDMSGAPAALLFDWLPESSRSQFSPLFVAADANERVFEWIDQGWGKDALVCLFSTADPAELLEHLRQVVRGKDRKDLEPAVGRLLGFCWPGVAGQLLAHRPAASAAFLIEGIEAVLVEGEPPALWQVFSGEAFRRALEDLGLAEADTQPQAAATFPG